MKITRVEASALKLPVDFAMLGIDRRGSYALCYVEIETDNGCIGHGITSHAEPSAVADLIRTAAGPAIPARVRGSPT